MDINSIFGNILSDKENKEFYDIFKNENVRIETIVSNGLTSQKDCWYDLDENQFVMIIEGHAILQFEDKEVEMFKGSYLNIPKNCKHRIKYISTDKPTIWLAVFY